MAKQLLSPLRFIARMNFPLKNYSCELFNLTTTVGKVKSVQSALSDLLTTSATHGTFSRPSTKRGLILIGLELNANARESFEHC